MNNEMRWFNTENDWGVISIAIHWLSALIVFWQFGFGLWMVELSYYDAWYHKAPDLHKSIGLLFLMLTLIRLVSRQYNCIPKALINHTPREQKIALIIHCLLYWFLFTVMISGYLISTADGRAVAIFNWIEVPATLYGVDKQEDVAGVIHLWLAICLIGSALLHILAAFKHHFFNQDRTLKRMFGL